SMSVIHSRVPQREAVRVPTALTGLDLQGALIWIISVGAVVYLGLNGGGYDTAVWAGVGAIAWWIVVLVVLVALDVIRRPAPVGWVAIAALAGLALWSAIGMNWSASAERTLNEVARLSTYLG